MLSWGAMLLISLCFIYVFVGSTILKERIRARIIIYERGNKLGNVTLILTHRSTTSTLTRSASSEMDFDILAPLPNPQCRSVALYLLQHWAMFSQRIKE